MKGRITIDKFESLSHTAWGCNCSIATHDPTLQLLLEIGW
jgi:hypothetical protein